MQFDVGGDESGGELGVGSGTSAGAPDLGGNVMQLFAVLLVAESVLRMMARWPNRTDLVGDNGATGCSCVCGDDDAAIVETADNGGSGAGGLGQRHTLGVQGEVAVVQREVESRHIDGACVCERRGR